MTRFTMWFGRTFMGYRYLWPTPHHIVDERATKGWRVTGRAHLYPHVWAHGVLMERVA